MLCLSRRMFFANSSLEASTSIITAGCPGQYMPAVFTRVTSTSITPSVVALSVWLVALMNSHLGVVRSNLSSIKFNISGVFSVENFRAKKTPLRDIPTNKYTYKCKYGSIYVHKTQQQSPYWPISNRRAYKAPCDVSTFDIVKSWQGFLYQISLDNIKVDSKLTMGWGSYVRSAVIAPSNGSISASVRNLECIYHHTHHPS